MALLIRALSLNDEPLSQPIQGVFDENGGSIGRADSNTMALPDPERLISREHARVTCVGGQYWIEDVGGGVSSVLNGKPVGLRNRVPLRVNDELRISAYRLVVGTANEDAFSVLRQRTGPHPLPVGAGDRAIAAVRPGPASPAPGPFDDIFNDLTDTRPRRSLAPDDLPPLKPQRGGHVSTRDGPSSTASMSDPRVSGAALNDFDPFGDLPDPPAMVRVDPQSDVDDPLQMLSSGSPAGSSLDRDFGLSASSGDDALASFLGSTRRDTPGLSPSPLDLGAGDGLASGSASANGVAASNHVPEINSGYVPPRVLADSAAGSMRGTPPGARPAVDPAPRAANMPSARTAAASTPPPVDSSASQKASIPSRGESGPLAEDDALWAEFIDGLGLPAHFPQKPTPHVMRTLGMVMRQMVDGTLQLIRARSIAKNQLRTEATIIESRNNNPLKFSPDAKAALSQLLQPPQPGFLSAPDAIRDAFDDLQSHQIGTMAGMRAALEGLLARFEPARLESHLVRRSALDSLIPSSRKAKLWDMYVQHFESIRGDAEEGFHELYGKAFIAAYEKQVERLRRAQANEQR